MDYGNPTQSVAGNPPVGPSKTFAKWRWLIITIVIVIIVVVTIFVWRYRSSQLPASLGFIDRTPLNVAGLDQVTKYEEGMCLPSYILQAGGRNNQGEQTFLLTIDVAADFNSEAELIAYLANPSTSCPTELLSILDRIQRNLNAPKDKDILAISYRTKAGKRFILPE